MPLKVDIYFKGIKLPFTLNSVKECPSKAYVMPSACTKCGTAVSLTPDWTLWPWKNGKWLCSKCNDDAIDRKEDPDAG